MCSLMGAGRAVSLSPTPPPPPPADAKATPVGTNGPLGRGDGLVGSSRQLWGSEAALETP